MRLLGVFVLAAMLLAGIGAALGTVANAADPQGDAARGARVYARCEGCHSLDANRVGPLHRGVVGRKAGAVPGYDYSPALKQSGIVWDAAALDAWLANPSKLVPGTKMGFRLNDPQARADVIAYLKAESGE